MCLHLAATFINLRMRTVIFSYLTKSCASYSIVYPKLASNNCINHIVKLIRYSYDIKKQLMHFFYY